jgi:Flp pilus assembly protein TadD
MEANMSRMLSPAREALDRAAKLTASGHSSAARSLLFEISLDNGLSSDEKFRWFLVSAEIARSAGRFSEARRMLRNARRLRPDEAEIEYLWGRCLENDPLGCDRRAARKYRKATTLNASEPKYRAALGRALVRISNVRSGVKVLRRAAEAAPDDPEVLAIVQEGLFEAEQTELALQILNKAMFLAPGNRAVRSLWERARFDATAESQRLKRTMQEPTKPERPATLPFVRIHNECSRDHADAARILHVRRDAAEPAGRSSLKAFRA